MCSYSFIPSNGGLPLPVRLSAGKAAFGRALGISVVDLGCDLLLRNAIVFCIPVSIKLVLIYKG